MSRKYKFRDPSANYIHENPVQYGFVDSAIEYPYSSAHNYSGEKGLVNIELAYGD